MSCFNRTVDGQPMPYPNLPLAAEPEDVEIPALPIELVFVAPVPVEPVKPKKAAATKRKPTKKKAGPKAKCSQSHP